MSAMESVKDVLLASGAGWVLWFLGLLSVSSLALAAERWIYLRRRSGNLEALARALDDQLAGGGRWRPARRSRRGSPTPGCAWPTAGWRLPRRGCRARPRWSAPASSGGW